MIPKTDDQFTYQFFEYAKKMMANSKMHEDNQITPENTYQVAHKENRNLLYEIISKSHVNGSNILGVEHLIKLYELAQQGKSCLILSEHVSNLDVPSMFVRFYDHENPLLKEIFEKIIFIAGVKLNENQLVKLYTEMFSRVVIYPIRSLNKLTGSSKEEMDLIHLAKRINISATRKIRELRSQGHLFVMYPAGTRYRPWDPSTKKGIKEATSYLKSFDYFCCCAINGNNMTPKQHEDMTREKYVKDVITFSFSEVKHTVDYIDSIVKDQHFTNVEDKDKMKQFVVDNIMNDIDKLHDEAEEYRKNYL